MSGMSISLLMFGVMVVLLMLGIPVGVSLLLVGGVGYIWVSGLEPMLNYMNSAPYFQVANYGLSVIPLFVPIVFSMALLTLVCLARTLRGGKEFR